MTKKLILMAALAVTAAPALAQGGWDWRGGGEGDPRPYRLVGPGVPMLLPQLRDTRRGQAWVLRNFDRNRDGVIEPWEARAADRAFSEIAGPVRGPFDWDRYDRGPGPRPYGPGPRGPVAVEEDIVPLAPVLRPFHPRQTRYGATFDFGDVLFATNSATLRPAASDRIRDLAGFLMQHPRIRVRVDGYTDSRASAAYNQRLSEARATSVEQALARLGVSPERMQVAGHGEDDPVATNATPEGRQQNRRVEVTLVGLRADRFGQ